MAAVGNGSVRISAKTDYALRAAVELATVPSQAVGSLTAQAIASAQHIPLPFLLNILADLRRVGLVDSRRGAGGGWWLTKPADQITVAQIVNGVDGSLTGPVYGTTASDAITSLVNEMWSAVRRNIHADLDGVTIADLASGALPQAFQRRGA